MKVLTRMAASGLLLAAAVALSAPAMAQTKVIISNDNNALGLKGKTFEYLKTQIEKELGDKAAVELHHSGALFNQKTQVQGLQLGSVHIISPTAGIYSPIAPKVNALLLPFLLSTPKAIDVAMKDPLIQKEIISELEAKNIKPVAIWINGGRHIGYRGSKAVRVPADMKGMKIRVQSADIFVESMKAFGANVIAMSWGEVPTALQQGVIDAAEPTPNAWVGSKIYELVDQITRNGYVYSFYIVTANKSWWEGLPADVRGGLERAFDATTAWNWENGARINNESWDKIRAAGKTVVEITPEERAQWIEAVRPVWKKLGNDLVGDAVMARLEEIGNANR